MNFRFSINEMEMSDRFFPLIKISRFRPKIRDFISRNYAIFFLVPYGMTFHGQIGRMGVILCKLRYIIALHKHSTPYGAVLMWTYKLQCTKWTSKCFLAEHFLQSAQHSLLHCADANLSIPLERTVNTNCLACRNFSKPSTHTQAPRTNTQPHLHDFCVFPLLLSLSHSSAVPLTQKCNARAYKWSRVWLEWKLLYHWSSIAVASSSFRLCCGVSARCRCCHRNHRFSCAAWRMRTVKTNTDTNVNAK